MGLHPWRHILANAAKPSIKLLQFGHGFAPMETWLLLHCGALYDAASIRPWVCTHGDEYVHEAEENSIEGFNSAMGLHPWRLLR